MNKHICWCFETDKMLDVVIRNSRFICCRRCGKELEENQINKKLMKEIKSKLNNEKNEKYEL